MESKRADEDKGVLKSVFIAYMIIVLHIVLLAGVGILVLFFRGVVNYMLWIFVGVLILIALSGYLVYRRMRSHTRNIGEVVNSPAFRGRDVEVKLLGGLASLKLGGSSSDMQMIDYKNDKNSTQQVLQLESPDTSGANELIKLASLLDRELITKEEYEKAKQKIFDSY